MHLEIISAEESLPDKNRLIVAYLDGYCYHSDLMWKRAGWGLMVMHEDGWSRTHYEAALKRLDADGLEVTHWAYLPTNLGEE